MKRYVYASFTLVVITFILGIWLQSVGVGLDGKGPVNLAAKLNLPNSSWPLIFPVFGAAMLGMNLILKRPAIRKLWYEKSVGKAGVITAFGIVFGPLLALLMQSFIGLKFFDLIDARGAMLGLAILQMSFFLVFGNYVAAARHDIGGGFKTRWTAQSDIVWKKTQRFVGHGVTLVSVLAVSSLFFASPKAAIFAHIASVMIVKLMATVYSYTLWRQENTGNAYDHL